MTTIDGKLVLITGASSGIGEALSEEAAKRGARVIMAARGKEKLEKIAARIQKSGGQAIPMAADLTDAAVVSRVAKTMRREMGSPDLIINNAGVGAWKYLDETSLEEARRMIEAPYLSSIYVTKAFLNDMLRRDSGHIVNMTSAAAFFAWPGATCYTAARWAMRGFSEALASDLSHTGVRTTLALFAKVSSPYWRHNPGSESRVPKAQKMIRVITPVEAAKAVLRGVRRDRRRVVHPWSLKFVLFQARLFPGTTRLLMNLTGHKRNMTPAAPRPV